VSRTVQPRASGIDPSFVIAREPVWLSLPEVRLQPEREGLIVTALVPDEDGRSSVS
jgi:hypothetical protein